MGTHETAAGTAQKRPEVLILANNETILDMLRNDNDIFTASRYNANTVVFDRFRPVEELGKMHSYHRVFIINLSGEERNIDTCLYPAVLRQKVTLAGGQTFVYPFPESCCNDMKKLFPVIKTDLIVGLNDMYKDMHQACA